MKKRYVKLLIAGFGLLGLTSCAGSDPTNSTAANVAIDEAEKNYNKDEAAESVTAEAHTFINKDTEYTVAETEVNAYYVNGSAIPYVDVEEFTKALDGYVDEDSLKFTKNDKVLTIKNTAAESVLTIDTAANTMSFTDGDFNLFYEEGEETDYMYNLKNVGTHVYSDESGYTYSFSDYYINLYTYGEKTLIPFAVYNDVFGSKNYYLMYFNGDNFYGTNTGVSEEDDTLSVLDGSLNSKIETSEERIFNYHHMAFIFENEYGLYKDRGVSSFDELAKNYKTKLLSTSPSVYYKAYCDFIYKYIDEGHTYLTSYGYHGTSSERANYDITSIYDFGDNMYNLYYDYYMISYDYNRVDSQGNPAERKMTGDYNASGLVYFSGTTAMFEFDEFTTGTRDEIYNASGSVKDDAYEYDTYYYFKKCFDLIDGKSGITNVAINLSRNGGGNIAALLRVLGFVLNGKSSLSEEYISTGLKLTENYRVDLNNDGVYGNETDYASKYNIYLVTSHYTYSAANTFAAYAKYYGNIKLIGSSSGGGACSILPTVMADGTTLFISSTLKIYVADENGNNMDALEDGIQCDYTLADYSYFLSTKRIDEAIKNMK